jgi:hypothetical protein
MVGEARRATARHEEEAADDDLLYVPSGAEAAAQLAASGAMAEGDEAQPANVYVRPEGLKRTGAAARLGLGLGKGAGDAQDQAGKESSQNVKKWRTVARVAGITAALRKDHSSGSGTGSGAGTGDLLQ